MRSLAIAAALLLTGCAASVGPVSWAIGDARVEKCPATAAPDCRDLTKGGTFSSVLGAVVGGAVEAAERFFSRSAAPPTIVIQNEKPTGESSGPPSSQ